MTIFHYARVSTDGQTIENQRLAAKQAGYAIDYYFADEAVSGKVDAKCREQYAVMYDKLERGDMVIVSEISRIGRNTVDVLTNIEKFEEMGVKVCVLSYGNLDLTSDIGKFVITMAAAMSQMELADLRRRTIAGLERTKAQGTRLGPPLTVPPETLQKLIDKKQEGATLDSLAGEFGIPRNTIHRNLREWADKIDAYSVEWEARKSQYERKAA